MTLADMLTGTVQVLPKALRYRLIEYLDDHDLYVSRPKCRTCGELSPKESEAQAHWVETHNCGVP